MRRVIDIPGTSYASNEIYRTPGPFPDKRTSVIGRWTARFQSGKTLIAATKLGLRS